MRRLATAFGPLLAAAAVCAFAGGCGDSGPTRQEVTGQVLLKGKPLDEGIIDFEPLDGQATKSGATILNGAYRIPKGDKGLLPGRYKVHIVGGVGGSGGGAADPEQRSPGFVPGQKDRVPPEYNEKSNVVREVTQAGPNRFDFKIP